MTNGRISFDVRSVTKCMVRGLAKCARYGVWTSIARAPDARCFTRVGFILQFFNLPSVTARENAELITEIPKTPMDAVEALSWSAYRIASITFPRSSPMGKDSESRSRVRSKRPELLLFNEPTVFARQRQRRSGARIPIGTLTDADAEALSGAGPGDRLAYPSDELNAGVTVCEK
jgi:hypothetical protein